MQREAARNSLESDKSRISVLLPRAKFVFELYELRERALYY